MSDQQVPIRVPNYLVGSILATLFCCIPTGIASIVFASKANSKAATGDIQGALKDAGSAKLWMWISIIPGFLIGFIGLLAAVSLPAYQDYTIRAKVSEVLLAGSAARTSYTEFVQEHQAWPSSADLGLLDFQSSKYARSVRINDEHSIEITAQGEPAIEGKTVLLVPTVEGNQITKWTCGPGTMPAKYLPGSCRG